MENNSSIKDLFEQVLGFKVEDMEINQFYDVSHLKVGIKSFNHISNEIEYNLINKIVRKKDSDKFIIKGNGFEFNTSANHKLLIKIHLTKKEYYEEVKTIIDILKIQPVYVLDESANWVELESITKDGTTQILDLEVDRTNNYFSNGILSHNTIYGNPEVTTGGNALKFFSSQRVEVSKGTQLKQGEDIIGYVMKIRVVKNKIAPPFRKAEVNNMFGTGIDKFKDMLNIAVDKGLIVRSGSWYSYEGTKLGQGIDKVAELVKDNPELIEELEEKIKTTI